MATYRNYEHLVLTLYHSLKMIQPCGHRATGIAGAYSISTGIAGAPAGVMAAVALISLELEI